MCNDRALDFQTTIVNSLFNLLLPHPGLPKLSQPSTTMTYLLSSNSSQVRLDHRRLLACSSQGLPPQVSQANYIAGKPHSSRCSTKLMDVKGIWWYIQLWIFWQERKSCSRRGWRGSINSVGKFRNIYHFMKKKLRYFHKFPIYFKIGNLVDKRGFEKCFRCPNWSKGFLMGFFRAMKTQNKYLYNMPLYDSWGSF